MCPFSPSYPERTLSDISGQTFDYVIVGGGTAGCAVASRLSEDPNVRVLVLERGKVRDHWLSRIPLISGSLLGGASLFQLVQRLSERPDGGDGASAKHPRRADLRTAEALGGASRINQMLWTRGAPGMYNSWAEELGHPDWSWEKVEPFFRKIEDAAAEASSSGRHTRTYLGRGGPVHLRRHEPQFEIYDHVDKAAAALGLSIDNDVNDPEAPPSGYFALDSTIDRNGARHSAYSAYLPKEIALERRDRLAVCTGVVASTLEVDASQQCVRGVHVRSVGSKGGSTLIKAEREVIICSGAICSPQLLMLSGIGSAEQLEPLGVPVHKNLPGVGARLSDHHGIPIMMQIPFSQTLHRLQSNLLFAIWQVILWIWNKTGILKSGTTAATIYVNTSHIDTQTSTMRTGPYSDHDAANSSLPENVPDVEIMVIPAGTVLDRFQGLPLCSFYTCLVRPRTTGRVTLASGTDPEHSPLIHYRALDGEHDRAAARKALRFALHLAEQFALKSGYRHAAELFYAPGVQAGRRDIGKWRDLGDDELDAFAQDAVQSVLHLGCTCRMAPEGDGGVVDDRLRVHGFRNLRVADASVFPRIPAAHTMAATYMVAERCAEFVKEDWKDKSD
ncbi:GMC oxidoreductase [Apiospora aurea]|uniref:GMC oxidoreductase n=1 Tax=Apiospora aurea TaxID=335848 RepID=A0ABR1Q0R9_9PEZI